MGNLNSVAINASVRGRTDEEIQEPVGPHKWPSMSLTWEEFQNRRVVEDPDMLSNGFEFDGVVVPETVMELILSKVRPEDIPNCNLVCRNWKDLITRKSYWKKWFIRKGWDWNMIPDYVKSKPEGWIVLYAQVRQEICSRNFILNHSGEAGFDNWSRFKDGGDGWRVENPAEGCESLPDDPFFKNIKSAFVTSFHWCSKWTMIDLWEIGLTPPVMTASLPFELVCSQMYAVRWDCGGHFTWTLRILDINQQPIMDHEMKYEVRPQMEWHSVEYAFRFKQEYADKMNEVRYLVFVHDGKDNQFWKGHYGTKFARSCVKFRIREFEASTDEEDVDTE